MERVDNRPHWNANLRFFDRYLASVLVSLLGKYRHVHLVRCLIVIYTALSELVGLMHPKQIKKWSGPRIKRNKSAATHQLLALLRNKNMATFLASFDFKEFFKLQDSPFTA